MLSNYTTRMVCMRTNFTFPTTSKEPSPNTKHFCSAQGMTMENFALIIRKHTAPIHFFTKTLKMFTKLDGFMYGEVGVSYLSISELCYQIMTLREQLRRARHKFYMISDSAKICPRIVVCSLYTRQKNLKDAYHQKKVDMHAYTRVDVI